MIRGGVRDMPISYIPMSRHETEHMIKQLFNIKPSG